MRFSSQKSWSQETLSLKRHLAGTRETGFVTSEKRAMLLLAVKTAMAAGFCYWLATLAHLQDGYWGSISAIIVLQSNVGSTVAASRDRLIGTLIGAAFGGCIPLSSRQPLGLSSRGYHGHGDMQPSWFEGIALALPELPSPSSCWCIAAGLTGRSRFIARLRCCLES